MRLSPEDWARARAIFDEALALAPAERQAYLEAACGGRPEVRAEVDSLLDAHDRSGDFLARPVFEAAAHLVDHEGAQALDGRTIGPYIIRQEIGRGGMGVVYLADDTRLSRRVALKALPPEVGSDSRHRDRLRQEARAAAVLSHPGIATIYALEEIDGSLYLACEYVPGPTLRSAIDAGRLSLFEAVDIALQLARALAAAHGQGVVHRDLKPENVVRTSAGMIKILDFGVARHEGLAHSRLTQEGDRLGTPAYMAPEQIRGEDGDFRTDLFSFGVLVYELSTGSNPFEAATRDATLARILEFDPPPLTEVCPAAPEGLGHIVAVCLSKQRTDRYRSTQELIAALERSQAEMSLEREGATLGQPSARRTTSRPARKPTPRWWWEFHQAAVSAVYILMMYPAWRAHAWLPPPWGTVFLLAALTCAAAATTLRLHLWFTSRFSPAELAAGRLRAGTWTRLGDAGLAAALLAATFGIAVDHQGFAMLFVTTSVAALLAAFVIEPTTAKSAFGANGERR